VEDLEHALEDALVNGLLPCASAFSLAKAYDLAPLQIGEAADRLGVRLCSCQLGLFGYGSKAEGTYRRVKPLNEVAPEVAALLRTALGEDGRLACAQAWAAAKELGLPRQHVADAAETLGLRIAHCQLGAF